MTSEQPKIEKKKSEGVVGGLLMIGFVLFAAFIWRSSTFRISKNFDVVDPGRFYRSAQLTPKELEQVIDQYGIKTVISMRGAPENSFWVKPQQEVLERKGVKFVTASWMTDFFPDKENFLKFAHALREEQYPILVHCRTGADRTGEASAIYAMEFMGQSKEEAIQKNLNVDHYHVATFHPAKSEFIRRWKGLDEMISTYDLCAPEWRDFAEPKYCPEPAGTAAN